MRYHFFINEGYHDAPIEKIRELSKELDGYGYYSFLQVYDNSVSDVFIKNARALDESDRIRFMVALRPRALSPEYCAMMISAFNRIVPDRLMLNIIHGNLAPHEFDAGVIDLKNHFSSKSGTLEYTRVFLEKLLSQGSFKNSPAPLVVSGANPETVKMAQEYGDYLALDYERFKDKYRNFDIGKRTMVTFDPVIFKTEKECLDFENKFKQINTVVKTEEQMLFFIKELEASGATDVLLTQSINDPENTLRVHEFVKNHSGN